MEFIYEIKDALPKEICEEMIKRFKSDNRKSKSELVGGRVNEKVRKSTNLFFSTYEDWKDVDRIMFKVFSDGFSKYEEYINDYTTDRVASHVFSDIKDEGYFIQEMKEGEYYHWHVDDTTKFNKPRSITCLLYLNTLEEDQGGYTEFWCGKKVRPEQGKLLIFPSCWTYIHRGAPVKNSGVKYTCGTWAI